MLLTDDLLHYWKLDGNSADSVGSRHGVDTGVTYGPEKIGDGVRIAAGQVVAISGTPSKLIHSAFTVDGWTNPGATVSEGGFFCDSGRGLYYNQGNQGLNFYDSTAAQYASPASSFPQGTRKHFAMTLSGGTLKYYANGVLVATHTGVVWGGGSIGFWRMGNDGGGYQFIGSLDEVGYWTRALSADEVARRYNLGAGLPLAQFISLDPVVEKYARTLRQLLPPGTAFNLEPTSKVSKTMIGAADEFARLDGRAAQFVEESDPRTADETIEQWEAAVGLPDEAIPVISSVLAERRRAVVGKLVAQGGQNEAFFIELAAALGYTVTITRHATPLRSGAGRSGDRLYGAGWANTLGILVTFEAADALTHAEFEATIRKHTHSHITVVFTY